MHWISYFLILILSISFVFSKLESLDESFESLRNHFRSVLDEFSAINGKHTITYIINENSIDSNLLQIVHNRGVPIISGMTKLCDQCDMFVVDSGEVQVCY